ncbi:DUF4238 domain-containing protein [Actinosynnema mirum]|uniref:DUF4238 domain-containing protein n=1 Tax=Actinosynnema mirum TaxID=40567 RepID=UPI00117CFAAD|nr:DUF4238 domain-containing protein [Actinosynnema mirum]
MTGTTSRVMLLAKTAAHGSQVEARLTNDHTVPQMYLRRFGWQRKPRSKQWFIAARRVEELGQPFEANVKNVAAVTDFYGEQLEKLLCQLEGDAVPAFDAVLEDPRGALPGPDRWPLKDDLRMKMAWWIAAQIVRNVRQRRRLLHLASEGTGQLAVPQSIKSLAGKDLQVRFMVDQLARMSWSIFSRPWGLGFSDLCLWTGDVPVVVVNGHDDENQLLATSFWDVVLPLDPHRFLFLPNWSDRRDDPQKRVDHLLKMDQGIGQIISAMVFEAADSHVFCHRDHDPSRHLDLVGPRLPRPWTGETGTGPSWVIEYPVMEPGWTIERRWLTEHPPPQETSESESP